MTRRTAATHLLTAVLWLATAVILLAMLPVAGCVLLRRRIAPPQRMGWKPLLVLLALIVFVRKFKLYGDLADKVHAYIVDREHKRTDGE